MITILITQTTPKDVGATQSFIVSETPTQHKSKYDEPIMDKKYEVRDFVKQESVTIELLRQNIIVDAEFDLTAVIKAINAI